MDTTHSLTIARRHNKPMQAKPIITSVDQVAASRLFKVEELSLSFSNGEQRKHERLNNGGHDVVVVMPIDQAHVYLVYEYATGFDRYELGFVKGKIDDGENAKQAANRELQEEISLGANHIHFVREVTTRPHYSTSKSSLFIAQNLYSSQLAGDEPEELQLVKWPLEQLEELFEHPDITEARTLCALSYLQHFLLKNNMNNALLLPKIVTIARDAGKAILEIYQSDFDFETKGDGSPLTIADQKAHNLIEAALQSLTPDIPILSEESYEELGDARLNWPIYWLVDPLDGTKEFIKKNGEFTVNIALIENRKPVLGVVHTPVKDITHFATIEGGAFIQTAEQTPSPIQTASLNRDKATMVASRSHMSDEVNAFQVNLAKQIKEVESISMGSSLKLCLVAEGKADYYPRLGLTSEWDTGAAQCVVEAAGGKVIAANGEPLLYSKKDILNPWFLVIGDTSVEINFEGELS